MHRKTFQNIASAMFWTAVPSRSGNSAQPANFPRVDRKTTTPIDFEVFYAPEH